MKLPFQRTKDFRLKKLQTKGLKAKKFKPLKASNNLCDICFSIMVRVSYYQFLMSRIKSESIQPRILAQIYSAQCLLHRFSRIMASWSSWISVSGDVISVETAKLCLPSQVCLDLQTRTVKMKTNGKRQVCKSVLPSSRPTLPM